MNLNELTKMVAIEQPTWTVNSETGERYISEWTLMMTAWAKVYPLSASEQVFSEARGLYITHDVTLHYCSSITNEMRIKYNDRYLYIGEIFDVFEQHMWMKITCGERK